LGGGEKVTTEGTESTEEEIGGAVSGGEKVFAVLAGWRFWIKGGAD
jgi:hypothetical protein